jgi:hypothetical protein
MQQTPMPIWNQIAKAQPLSQPWSTLFRATPETLPGLLAKLVDEPAEAAGADNKTVLAMRLVAPLLVESEAISAFILEEQNPSLRTSLPEVNSVNEAVMMASQEYRLNPSQQAKLTQLLKAQFKLQSA